MSPVAEVVRLQLWGLPLKSHDFSYRPSEPPPNSGTAPGGLPLKSHDFSYGAQALSAGTTTADR
jgi:hypothetical protein